MSESLNLPQTPFEKFNRPTRMTLVAAGVSLLITFCLLIWTVSSLGHYRTQLTQFNDQLGKQNLLIADLQAKMTEQSAQQIAAGIIQQLRAEQTAAQTTASSASAAPAGSLATPSLSTAATSPSDTAATGHKTTKHKTTTKKKHS